MVILLHKKLNCLLFFVGLDGTISAEAVRDRVQANMQDQTFDLKVCIFFSSYICILMQRCLQNHENILLNFTPLVRYSTKVFLEGAENLNNFLITLPLGPKKSYMELSNRVPHDPEK